MKKLLKNYLLLNKISVSKKSCKYILVLAVLFTPKIKSQVINYVSNGSFESLNSHSVSSLYNSVNYWQPIDTNKYCDYLATKLPPFSNAPYALGFQYPRTGNNYIITSFLDYKGYPRNRLKQKLKANTVYCAKYHIVNTNNNPYAVDGFGMYFADSTLDTINYCNVSLSYLIPQIQHNGGVITDTLNWIPITGTFVANGTEKYLVLGNFKTDAATNTLLINPTYSTTTTADICIDDVSCIELNLPAFAGRDTFVYAGSPVFLGRQPDVGIDEACIWYKLPGTVPIDTIAGFWVTPTATSTYVVRQEICGLVKWDTVTIDMSYVGIDNLKVRSEKLKVWPVPADNILVVEGFSSQLAEAACSYQITNSLGQLIREEEITFKDSKAQLKTGDLPAGVYVLNLTLQQAQGEKSVNSTTVSKRFVVAR